VILALGDCNIQGADRYNGPTYADIVAQKLEKRLINAGITMSTVREGKILFDRHKSKKPDIVIDEAVIVDLFERLEGDDRPQRIAFRYIIALVLLRKRKLKLVGREDVDDGEIWLLRWSGTDSDVARVHNPGIKEDEIHGLSDQLSDLLQGDM